jgi:hypothetical protein
LNGGARPQETAGRCCTTPKPGRRSTSRRSAGGGSAGSRPGSGRTRRGRSRCRTSRAASSRPLPDVRRKAVRAEMDAVRAEPPAARIRETTASPSSITWSPRRRRCAAGSRRPPCETTPWPRHRRSMQASPA